MRFRFIESKKTYTCCWISTNTMSVTNGFAILDAHMFLIQEASSVLEAGEEFQTC